MRTLLLLPALFFPLTAAQVDEPFGRQVSPTGILHSFVISGTKTACITEDSRVSWSFDQSSRDAAKLPNGNYLVVLAQEALELSETKEELWKYTVSAPNTELMGGQCLADGNTLLTELGLEPRLVEVSPEGKVVQRIAIQPETDNTHMQSRMSRKLPSGNYLVPHRLMPFCKEYDGDGTLLKVFRTDLEELGGSEAHNGTFCAVRLANGNTIITCTTGNKVVEFDPTGKPVWVVTSAEVGGIINDVCGLQVLKNGNIVIASYGNQSEEGVKMMEITRDKKVVWKFYAPSVRYVHNLQVLTTNGAAE